MSRKLIVLLVLVGCAPATFGGNVDPMRNTQMAFAQDRMACERVADEAMLINGQNNVLPNPRWHKNWRETFKNCMIANGWQEE